MVPHVLTSESRESESVNSRILSLINANPFGTTTDPIQVRGSTYTSAITIINQTIYSLSSKIFSFETVGAENLIDSYIQLWLHKEQTNAFGIVPFYYKFEVRSGAANAILGYFKKNGTSGQPVSALLGANGLDYMRNSLSGQRAPLALNVSAIDFMDSFLVSNYGRALSVGRELNFPVFTPVESGVEMQHLAILNHFLAFSKGSPSMFLFDGVDAAKTFRKFNNLLSVEEIGEIYQRLLDSTNGDVTVNGALALLNSVTGKNYSQFEYVGDENVKTVFVVYGTFQSEQWSSIARNETEIGLVKVRVPSPFDQNKFLQSIPKSAKKVVVLSSNDNLIADISASLFLSKRANSLSIEEFKYPLDFIWTPITITKILTQYHDVDVEKILGTSRPKDEIITANSSPEGKYLFWSRDNSTLTETADKLALALSLDNTKNVSIRNKFDNSRSGGVFQSQIVSTSGSFCAVDAADVVVIENLSLLNSYDILATVKPGGTVIYINQKHKIDPEKLSFEFKKSLALNHNKLIAVDFTVVEALDETNNATIGMTSEFLLQLSFWRAALPELGAFIVNKLLQANGGSFELLATVLDNFIKAVDEKNAIVNIEVSPEWADLEEPKSEAEVEDKESTSPEKTKANKQETKLLPFFITENSLYPNPRTPTEQAEEVSSAAHKNLAQRLVFSEAFNVSQDLRPDLPVRNFVVKVQENKRLTPKEYSRNIFHIEFDTTGTGLKYEIGEALGIHGRNNSNEVERFLNFYGVDGNSLVEVTNKEDAKLLEIRSARQILSESIDFLGKPPKRFYDSLAEFATDVKEKEHLQKLASAEGAEELKKRQEIDFNSYFDILQEFKSARPKFPDLVKIIAPLKRREYSIASSQKIHPNAIHLLVVVVDWVDSKGRLRYGHCSKYLSDLKIGDELVVSVKPSVMKLPPLSTQPIVMSGLGTGLAPFKAFVEEKIWQQQQGMEIGDIYLYMGSRHKKEEYLYGELWEAYKDAGLLTHIGAAFSRDQPEKIYIQDRIRQTMDELTKAIIEKNGSFYLCGPTWPVPDITACLEDIVTNGAKLKGEEIKDAAKVVEDMKEEGRYILEVY
ncbi:MET10 [Candida oxycetoniae]|uniref:assimilatory sulfite reductase (NADPH) n=1 Tax=Candida oxycetoniae TaxID=497107 RepID=A0AAI9WYG1_9ASCO|nr:MET10 [Candida oxycetoniae]KAI3405256.2 MET10 [Candida oxycetoniae]